MSDELQNAATIASLRAEVERLKAELAAASEREDSLNVQMGHVRQALDTARERAGVLERECNKYRAYEAATSKCNCDVGADCERCGKTLMSWMNAVAETDRTHALDAAKFGGAT